MSPPVRSPATTFHDVRVTCDQSSVAWAARGATISAGAIEVTFAKVPAAMLENPSHTFTITASDGGGRRRIFPNVVVDHPRSGKTLVVFL